MRTFRVTYQYGGDSGFADRFNADKVNLTPDGEWFHFMVDEKIKVRVKAGDVRVIEDVTVDEDPAPTMIL